MGRGVRVKVITALEIKQRWLDKRQEVYGGCKEDEGFAGGTFTNRE